MRLTVLIITTLFVFSVVLGICFGQNRVVVIPLVENEATGNARSEDVLKDKTFSCDEGSGFVGTMPNIGTENIEPGENSQFISEGYHDGTGQVSGDDDLKAGNIREGAEVFGVLGTSVEASGLATDSEVLSGVTYSNANGGSTGTMPNIGSRNIQPGRDANPIPEGYHDGTGSCVGDDNLIPAKILSGQAVFGVTGTGTCISGDRIDELFHQCLYEACDYCCAQAWHYPDDVRCSSLSHDVNFYLCCFGCLRVADDMASNDQCN